MTEATEVKQHSVTAADKGSANQSAFIWALNMGSFPASYWDLPTYWSQVRDLYLSDTIHREGFWASAIYTAVSKQAAKGWDLESADDAMRERFQQMLLESDANQSWVSFLSKHLQDYLTTENGAFIEIVKATSAPASRTLGLMHLDSSRCTRTGDPGYPVVYKDTVGHDHAMREDQVIYFSDMPDPKERWYGVGHCAAARAWDRIIMQQAVNQKRRSMVTGERPDRVHLVRGVSPEAIQNAITLSKADAHAKPQNKLLAVTYLGAVVVPIMSDVELEHEELEFTKLPEGFDFEKELNLTLLAYADALGMDPQDLQPLSHTPLGTATQSQTLDAKAEGKGLATWDAQITHQLNQKFLPDSVVFAFSEKDVRQQQAQANVTRTRIETMGTAIDKKILTPPQAQQMLADEGEIPQEFVVADQTPKESISDEDKAGAEGEQQPAEDTPPEGDTSDETPDEEQVSTKELEQAKQAAYALLDRLNVITV